MAEELSRRDQVRLQAEASLESFIRLIHKGRVLGSIHVELIDWLTRPLAKAYQLVLLPRDHQKSTIAGGYLAAWELTRNPAIRILYVSSTANLAVKQLKFIKDILESDIYRFYWPEMILEDEGRREKWTESEIAVDHPKRKEEYIRDPTVFAAGLTTNISGMHCDLTILDDVVVAGNAYTEEGRTKTGQLYSLLASIEGANSRQVVVGTRYHPKDLYNDLVTMEVEQYKDGQFINSEPLYEVFERQVESTGDGSGEFLWPIQRRYDGKEFGFDQAILARKRIQYIDKVQFQAQYYNNPNDPEGAGLSQSSFQYYDKSLLTRRDGRWYFKDARLNVFSAVDFAFSLNKKADYTAIVVVGVDTQHNYYVLDISRFKTDSISEYFKHILDLYKKWDFRKLRAEVTQAQEVIVKELKNNYIRTHGLSLSVDEFRPTRNAGNKQERVRNTLIPKYDNKQIWHYQGGHCQTLEEELLMSNPSHDDVKDALASCIETCVPPGKVFGATMRTVQKVRSRFGGI